MTPYGIVYSDNILSVNESKKQWLKREKTVSKLNFIMGYVIIFVIISIMNTLLIAFTDSNDSDAYAVYFPIEIALSFVIYYITIKKNKETFFLQNCFSQEKKQAVLRENSAVFTSPYRQSEYYYDEIEQVVETENTITIFIDSKYSFPIYISFNNVEKGNIGVFRNILREKTGNKYIYFGGELK